MGECKKNDKYQVCLTSTTDLRFKRLWDIFWDTVQKEMKYQVKTKDKGTGLRFVKMQEIL